MIKVSIKSFREKETNSSECPEDNKDNKHDAKQKIELIYRLLTQSMTLRAKSTKRSNGKERIKAIRAKNTKKRNRK